MRSNPFNIGMINADTDIRPYRLARDMYAEYMLNGPMVPAQVFPITGRNETNENEDADRLEENNEVKKVNGSEATFASAPVRIAISTGNILDDVG